MLVSYSCALLANFCALLANRCAMLDKSRALLANSCALLNKSCVLLANPCAPFVYIHCLYLVHITRVKVYAMSSTGFKWTQDKLLIAKNMIVTGKKNQEIMDSIGCKIRSIQKFRAAIESVEEDSRNDIIETYIGKRGKKPNIEAKDRLINLNFKTRRN